VVPEHAQDGQQLFAGLEDLLDHDVRRPGERGQPVEVGARVAQAVGVVDAQAVDETDVEPAPDLRVRGAEDLRSSTRIPASVVMVKNRR
jgi:hypothetical protein